MNNIKTRLADEVNIDDIIFKRQKKTYKEQALVSYAKSTKTLLFNKKMVKILSMEKWRAVLAGYDKKTKIIVLKCCEPDEYGSCGINCPRRAPSQRKGQRDDGDKEKRIVAIPHVAKAIGLTETTSYRAEREGDMIYLKDAASNGEQTE